MAMSLGQENFDSCRGKNALSPLGFSIPRISGSKGEDFGVLEFYTKTASSS